MESVHNDYKVDHDQDAEAIFASLIDLSQGQDYDIPYTSRSTTLDSSYEYRHDDTYAAFPQPSRLNQTATYRTDPQDGNSSNYSTQTPITLTSNQTHHVLRKSRSLPRKKSRYFSPQLSHQSTPLLIPSPNLYQHTISLDESALQLDPLQRWRDSPPESEPVAIAVIQRALQHDHVQSTATQPLPSQEYQQTYSFTGPSNAFRTYRQTSSAASSESGASESSQKTAKSGKSRNRSRLQARRTAKGKEEKEKRRFKCTFCCDDFRTKYDWTRHEKSLHLDLEEWHCAPHGSTVFSPATGRIHCAFCNALDPSSEHLKEHNFHACEKAERPTTFHRKDHLVQHLRLVHQLEIMPLIDDWKVNSMPVRSRCGFCSAELNSWDERVTHLADHFRCGVTMSDWRGDHNFHPSIAAKVRNAIPPYCIGDESHAIIPFVAGDRGTQDHFNQISSAISGINLQSVPDTGGHESTDSLCFDLINVETPDQRSSTPPVYIDMLANHLGRFARENIMLGNIPTDEMFQREARRVIYGCGSDGWNTTVADNEVWLSTFKGKLNPFG